MLFGGRLFQQWSTPHELKLKINCPVILLRNLDPNNGLRNGTRLMVRALQDNTIDAEIVGGQHVLSGKLVCY